MSILKPLIYLEDVLHPYITINGVLIMHFHFGKNVVFKAWDTENNIPINNKEFCLDCEVILRTQHFYSVFHDKFNWLVQKEEQ